MKKIAIIVLMFLYLIPAIGVSATVHYCVSKLSSITFIDNGEPKCGCNEKAMKKNCCNEFRKV